MTGSATLTHIMKDIPKELTGIEVGFLSTINEYAIHGAHAQAAM